MDEAMEYQCPSCGCYVPPGTTTCLLCKCKTDQDGSDPEPIDELLEELSALLNGDEEVGRNVKNSEGETKTPPIDVHPDEGRASRRVRKKVVYKKVTKKRA